MNLTLKNCRLADQRIVDIGITDGTISLIGTSTTAGPIIDLKGLLVIPGVIDAHVHFREPGDEHKEDWLTGSRAAVAGGVTTVLDMPNNNPPAIDEKILNLKRARAKKSLVNYGFFLGATKTNGEIIRKVKNIAGVKLFVGASTGSLLVDQDEDIAKLFSIPNILWVVHAEDETIIKANTEKFTGQTEPSVHSQIRSREAAIRAVERIISLARKTGARVHICHISTMEEVALITQAKEQGLPITGEVSPHHLFLNETEYLRQFTFVKVNPPLRTAADNQALMAALRSGVIDIVATDHAPHTSQEKNQLASYAPAGMPEIETSLPLLLHAVNNGQLELERMLETMTSKPAEIFNIKKKGKIEVGYDADLTVIDLAQTKIVAKTAIQSKCGWSPYEGKSLKGWPIMTLVNGNLAYDNGTIHEEYKGKEITYGKI